MASAVQNHSYYHRAQQHFQLAIQGEESICALAKKNLHPSSYQISLVGRAIHLIKAIVCAIPLVNLICDYVANYFYPSLPVPDRIDREYRLIEETLVPQKLVNEKRKALQSQRKEPDGIPFSRVVQADPPTAPFFTEQFTMNTAGSRLDIDMAWMQGKRDSMEDEHIATHFSLQIREKTHPISLFGVFDGHGGTQACSFLKGNIADYLKKYLEKGAQLTDGAIFNALKLAFVDLDRQFKGKDGSTACVAMLLDGNLWVANAGDTRVVLDNGGTAEQLSEDAKPGIQRFLNRIVKRGGEVTNPGPDDCPRVNGILAVAGAIGDHYLLGKAGYGCLTPRPKITKTPLSQIYPNSRLIIACDGLWDVASSKQAVQSKLSARGLMQAAYNAGSTDNISVMTISIPGTYKGLFS